MMQLLLIRHGESEGNRSQRMAGRSHDRLTDLGHDQCDRLGQFLHHGQQHPTHVYTSPLPRATESVVTMLTALGATPAPPPNSSGPIGQPPAAACAGWQLPGGGPWVPVIPCDDLMEFDAGIFTGLTWAEAQARYGELCHALETTPAWLPIPQAETPQQGRDRARRFISQILAQHGNGERLWVMTHHWILEHLVAQLLGCDRTWRLSIANTAWFEFWIDRDRWYPSPGDEMGLYLSDRWQIHRFGDCPHLHP